MAANHRESSRRLQFKLADVLLGVATAALWFALSRSAAGPNLQPGVFALVMCGMTVAVYILIRGRLWSVPLAALTAGGIAILSLTLAYLFPG